MWSIAKKLSAFTARRAFACANAGAEAGHGDASSAPHLGGAERALVFVHDQFADGRRFRVFNVVDDVTKECLAAVVDTSISGPRGRGS